MLGFETLTLAPIDLSLVEPKLMDADEIAWLNDSTRGWLAKATRRLARANRER
jgi:Xaa-Pro aminopeptidase